MTSNHLRTLAVALTAIVLVPIQAVAQEQEGSSSGPEVGVLVGLTHAFDEYDSFTTVGIPGGSVLGFGAPLYLSVPLGERASLRAEVSFLNVSDGSDSVTILDLGGYASMMLGSDSSGPYVLGGGALLSVEGESEFSVGAGLGHLSRVGTGLVVRLEARYERFTSDDFPPNVIQVLVGFGAAIG